MVKNTAKSEWTKEQKRAGLEGRQREQMWPVSSDGRQQWFPLVTQPFLDSHEQHCLKMAFRWRQRTLNIMNPCGWTRIRYWHFNIKLLQDILPMKIFLGKNFNSIKVPLYSLLCFSVSKCGRKVSFSWFYIYLSLYI